MDGNISVLIIEDDYHMCFLLEMVFEGFEIPCSSVNSLEFAKRKLESHIPTFIVLDNSLPDGKGIHFIEYLKTNFPCIKIIMCTSENLEFQLKKEIQVYEYVQKPFKIEKFREIIRDILTIPRCSRTERCFSQKCSRLTQVN